MSFSLKKAVNISDMAKLKLPKQRDMMQNLKRRIEKYMLLVQGIYDTYNLEAAKMAVSVGYDGEKPFRFSSYPQTSSLIEKAMNNWCKDMNAVIYRTTSEEWKKSNLIQDLIADKVMAYYYGSHNGKRVRKYYQVNSDALKAFQERRDYGMNLSQRIWNQSRQYKRELEDALSVGIQKGMSAVTLSKRISKYLNDFPSLQKDYKEKYGKATDCVNCEYRSMRLARNEINLAYRTAEQKRWEQMDFIIGKEIKTSDVHDERMPKGDICDQLAGKYPKDFLWRGWHVNCYSDDSEVLTNNGWKLFKDVSNDDLILSLNPETRNMEWVGISDMQCREHHGDMVHFYNKTLDCLVTPEHQMVYLNKRDGEIKKRPASEYKKTHGGFYRGCEHNAQDIESIEIGGEVYDFDTYCEFMAYYLSDGSTQHESGICIAQKDGERHKQKIVECLRRMGYEPKNYGETVYIYNSHLNRHLKQFGKAHDKHIPDEIKNASRRQIRLFLDAYLRCDGHTQLRDGRRFTGSHGNIFEQKREGRVYFTTSDLMARDLSELILKAGHRPSFYVHEPTTTVTSKGRVIKSNYPCWIIRECYSTTATVFEKENVPYDGFVYDVTLERNHIMYIRRNGKCFWGSNCMCYEVPIIKKDYDFFAPDDKPADREVTDVPENYKEWIKQNAERIEKAKERGTLPYFLKDNPSWNKYLEPSTLEKAEERHKARTPEEIEDIKKRWAEHEHKNKLILTTANNILKVAKDYGEVDVTKLQEAIDSGNLNEIRDTTRAYATYLSAVKKQEKALSDLIPDVHEWHKQFTMDELKGAHDAIESGLGKLEGKTLAEQKKWLENEIKYVEDPNYLKPHKIYPTWKVAQDAYMVKLEDVVYEQKLETIKKQMDEVWDWSMEHTKSKKVASLLQDYSNAIASKADYDTIQEKATLAYSEYQKRNAEQARRDAKKLQANAITFNEALSDTEYIKVAGRLYEKRMSDALGGKTTLSEEQENLWDEISRAIKEKDTDAVREKLSKLGENLDDAYSQSRKDAAVWHKDSMSANDYFFDETNTR